MLTHIDVWAKSKINNIQKVGFETFKGGGATISGPNLIKLVSTKLCYIHITVLLIAEPGYQPELN